MITRRKFLQHSSLATAASLIPWVCKGSAPKKKIGVALVGLGYYSRDLLAPALQKTQHCELRGVVTGSPEKIPTWQEQYGIPDSNVYSYDNMHTIADNDDIDVIYIVVPTGLHMKYAVIAANAGKHVWCEKPMAMNVEECQKIIDACTQNKVKLSIGYRMLHEPNTQKVIEYAASRPYGEMQNLTIHSGYKGGGGSGWRFERAMGGGALYDMGVYAVNASRYATGMMPVSVTAEHIIHRPDLFKEVDETTAFKVYFDNGLVADCRTSVGESINQLQVNCQKGWYNLTPLQSYYGVTGTTSDGQTWPAIDGMQQTLQMDNDALAIINDTPVMAPGIEGLKDIRIIEAILQSAASDGAQVSIV